MLHREGERLPNGAASRLRNYGKWSADAGAGALLPTRTAAPQKNGVLYLSPTLRPNPFPLPPFSGLAPQFRKLVLGHSLSGNGNLDTLVGCWGLRGRLPPTPVLETPIGFAESQEAE